MYSQKQLIRAIYFNNDNKVKAILGSQDVDINGEFEKKVGSETALITPLTYAVIKKRKNIIQLLLENNASVTIGYGVFPITEAAKQNDRELISLLIKYRKKADHSHDIGETLMYLIDKEDIHLMEYIMSSDIDINETTYTGELPVNDIVNKNLLEYFNLFVKYKFDPNAQDRFDQTPFYRACVQGNLEIVKTLIKLGSDINHLCDNGYNGFASAIKSQNIELITYLIEQKIELHKNSVEQALIQLYENKDRVDIVELLVSHYPQFDYILKRKRSNMASETRRNNKRPGVINL